MEPDRFTHWQHWNDRANNTHSKVPGLYLLARFEDEVPSEVDPLDPRILLVGETHGQTLQKRWNQFHYSAFGGGWGHSGGVNFHVLFANGPDSEVPHWLYVSATPVPPAVEDTKEFVQNLKAELLAEFEEMHGLLPPCNLKKGRKNISQLDDDPESEPEELRAAKDNPANRVIDQLPRIQPPEEPQQEPDIKFGKWSPWSEKYSLHGIDAAGVYGLGCFKEEPPSTLEMMDESIVYIGETCNNTLGGRLYQFDRSAFQGKSGHSGGLSFGSRCPGKGDYLYVSLLPVSTLAEPRRSAFIRHVERRLIWEYVHRFGQRPICNSK